MSKYNLTPEELKQNWLADIRYYESEILTDKPYHDVPSVIQFYRTCNHIITDNKIELKELERVEKFKIHATNKIIELKNRIKELDNPSPIK